MPTVGVVVEYNPLHNGHLYHLQQSKKITGADSAVAVMSGNFLQRGEPAIVDKWARTEMALRAGCDLVLELPAAYSSQPAQWFAYGAVAVLSAAGIVDALCFGSESGDIEALNSAAALLTEEPEELAAALDAKLRTGIPYPSAYTGAAKELLQSRGLGQSAFALDQPNHTLGLHYMMAMRRIGSRMKPFTVQREKAGYSQESITDGAIASATALRKLLAESDSLQALAPFVPSSTLDILRRERDAGRAPVGWEHFKRPLLHELLRADVGALAGFAEVTEGLEHRIKRVLFEDAPSSVESLVNALKTKRYTRTKLQRTLLRILLGHRKDELTADRLESGVQYIRVLGFTERGQSLLREMKTRATVPVVLGAARGDWPYLSMDARASAVYALAFREEDSLRAAWRDYTMPPVRVVD
ncbi:nucleotidyltransferase [Cohnella faecalis]|uniref:tRNA(Met) cytidine acetate ligase n=1 Tax=Cohnella faecalis TaxID=2315694 RepID=A0A398CPE4_9BACL|nr:nucleotidyltransferase [Cohnella faecalis]RIE04453.1 nucleotidyltransferase [Cohnella faecalis]